MEWILESIGVWIRNWNRDKESEDSGRDGEKE